MVVQLFTSYKCPQENEPIVKNILQKWKDKNPTFEILYFSDVDVKDFFQKEYPEYYTIYTQMRNGVAIADLFRICYIQRFGGYWFDLDLEPISFDIHHTKMGQPNVHLFDAGWGNISYMFIGGKPNQHVFQEVIERVINNIQKHIVNKTDHVVNITGPKNIQDILLPKMNLISKNYNFMGEEEPKIYLKDTKYEFTYQKVNFNTTKTVEYVQLLEKYKQKKYTLYNFL